jgi:hypothetical protein
MPLVEKNTFRIRSIHPVYKAGKDATAEQIQAAVKESFAKILRQAPDPSEMHEYSKLLTDDLKTYEPLRAVERFLTRVLSRPVVLYRVETQLRDRSGRSCRLVSSRAIAYSLTYSEPDEGLRKALAAGKLSRKVKIFPSSRSAQIKRHSPLGHKIWPSKLIQPGIRSLLVQVERPSFLVRSKN